MKKEQDENFKLAVIFSIVALLGIIIKMQYDMNYRPDWLSYGTMGFILGIGLFEMWINK